MARPPRSKPDDRAGLLLVNKQSGITSHDAVDIFRKRTRIKRVGHTGTLDPMATGLLVFCVGKTTRLQSYLMDTEKVYQGTIRFGFATDSYDATGTASGEQRDADVSGIDLAAAAVKFTGEIDQVPPQFSAKKVDGVRSYELARKGEAPVLEAKRVTVYEFAILGVEGSRARFRVRCSPGTYVRSLAHDLGQSLGVPSHLESLERTATGKMNVADAISTETMQSCEVEQIFAPPHFRTMRDIELPMPAIQIDRTQETRLQNGQNVIVKLNSELAQDSLVAIHNFDEELLAIATAIRVMREGGGPVELQPKVVLK